MLLLIQAMRVYTVQVQVQAEESKQSLQRHDVRFARVSEPLQSSCYVAGRGGGRKRVFQSFLFIYI